MTRFSEPSTYAGIGTLLLALNEIFDINEAGEAGAAMMQAAGTGSPALIVGAGIAAALAAIFKPEKKVK